MASAPKKSKKEESLSRLLFNNTEDLIEEFSDGPDEEKIGREDSLHAAWHDDDDDIEVGKALKLQKRHLPRGGVNDYSGKYSKLVKHKYKQIVGTPEWARLDKKVEYDSDEDVLQSVGHLSKSKSTSLQKNILEYKRLKLLNTETGNEGPIVKVIEFHPTSSVALVAGLSGIASLLTVDGKKNAKLHSMSFKKYPIHCARFSNDGGEAYIGSTFSYFYVYDLINAKALRVPLQKEITKMSMFELSPCGKFLVIGGRFGELHVLSAKTREYIKTLKQNSYVTALAFNIDSTKLYAHGSDGHVTVWDMSTFKIVHKLYDDGCVNGSCITISPSGDYVATGSAQGVVNIYNSSDFNRSTEPKPQKSILNLVTNITALKFNPNSEILAVMSSETQNAIRLVHLPSFEVFKNFPGLKPDFAHCNVINFSPNSGYMSFGTNKNRAYLYRLKHYKNY